MVLIRFAAYLMLSSVFCQVKSVPISGGEPVPADDKTFSFAVSIQYRERNPTSGKITYKHFCGGVLLQVFNRTGYVITASHCMVNIKAKEISVVFGAKNLKNYSGERYNTVSVYKKDYDRYTMAGDICILKVYFSTCDRPRLNPIRVILDEKTACNDACYIFGYGSEKISGDPTLDLRLAPVNIISYDSCLKELGASNAPERNSGMFCAVGANPGVDACLGDSGSGLLCIHKGILAIVGITSYGLDCGVVGMPGVYTTIAFTSNANFIKSVVSKSDNQ
ncbi:mite allergen Der f 3 isoform X2 [Sitodiplosis mosellana]|uniref:mite allergen Der f 3 isoform X2 n=1 Tax=Sitodiplosis mosellana TaxID=263140 RepID=UPI0024448E33|nr:mite allergen Der f 3 isoform X2 [Sitodiplosis mosellana]